MAFTSSKAARKLSIVAALWSGVLLCGVLVDRREYTFTPLTLNLFTSLAHQAVA
jgi:hypothetical protein